MVNKDSHAYNTGVLAGMQLDVDTRQATIKLLPSDQVEHFIQGWNDGVVHKVMSYITADLRNLPPHLQKEALKALISALVNRF